MNTPAHLILGLTAFGRAGRPRVSAAALAGSLGPDASLYVLVAWALVVQGHAPELVFSTLYFSDAWQAVFAVDNSFFVWGALLALALWRGAAVGIAFAGAGLLHLGLDFPLHHDDGRPHFWPLSDWVYESPISYWDPSAHGSIVGALEVAVCLALLIVLWRRHRGRWARGAIALSGFALAGPAILFGWMFA